VADDPLSVRDAHSEAKIKEHITWWTEVMPSRINPGDHVRYLVVQQRVTGNDLSGYLLREDGSYYHLNVPYEWQPTPYSIIDTKDDIPPPIYDSPTKDPRSTPGEILCPELWPIEKTESIKRGMTEQAWGAQYNGMPSLDEGNIFKRSSLKLYNNRPEIDPLGRVLIDGKIITQLLISVDCSFKEKTQESGSYVPIDVWGRAGADYYLIDTVCQQWGFDDTLANIRVMAKKYKLATAILIEKKANGPGVIATLSGRISGIIPVEPFGDKVERAFAIQPLVNAGNVHIPNPQLFPWVKKWLHVVTQFPYYPHDDWVDSMSQALLYWTIMGTTQGKYENLVSHGRKLMHFGPR
jgi:predicted phage terminase large subunit-like protein